jgi:hypothetical protein
MKFELTKTLRGRSDDELLELLRNCAEKLGQETVTMEQYSEHGVGHATTIARRFGSWPIALDMAGLSPSRSTLNIPENGLFQNLLELWISLQRQPTYNDVNGSTSRFSAKTYANRFGSWTKALESFVLWVNQDTVDATSPPQSQTISSEPDSSDQSNNLSAQKKRQPTLRQRFRVLERDRFTCQSCGASPAKGSDVPLEIDHIVPWSKGGLTEDANLEVKCKQCNLGKGNAFEA